MGIMVQDHGAAVVVMAFDEQGQAADEENKVGRCLFRGMVTPFLKVLNAKIWITLDVGLLL